ncbi:MAG: choice-of-anchor J domain-containing protein [Clostridia bacterium]|nr:choice-of-anchor J domain-containing protein [Clostridia bacterium]
MIRKLICLLAALMMALTALPAGVPAAQQTIRLTDPIPFVARDAVRMSAFPGASRAKLSVEEIVCDGSLLDEDFESNLDLGWWMENADGNTDVLNGYDFSNWLWTEPQDFGGNDAHSGVLAMVSYSWYDGATFVQDNWLGTPSITIPDEGYKLCYWAKSAGGEGYLDHMQVLVGEYGVAYDEKTRDLTQFTSLVDLYEVPAEYQQMMVDLSAYAGKTVSVAFRHVDTDKMSVVLDDVQIGLVSELVPETSVTLSASELELPLTTGARLTAEVLPENATFTGVAWTSSDPSVVAVNNAGGMIGMSVGTATVTATTHGGLTASCTVTVVTGPKRYSDGLRAFGLYDYGSNTPDAWYRMDRFGAASKLQDDGVNDLLVSEYDSVLGRVFGFVGRDPVNGEYSSYDYVRFDLDSDFAMIVVEEGFTDVPVFMTYDYEHEIMYAGYYYRDDLGTEHLDLALFDSSTGEKGETISDICAAVCTAAGADGETVTLQNMLPLHMTYAGGGRFIGADVRHDALIAYRFRDEEVYASIVSSNISSQVGPITTFYQKLWYNPMDAMLYWAGVFGTDMAMAVTSISSGITVRTGTAGAANAAEGMEVTALFLPYRVAKFYTVTFVDGLTGAVLSQQMVGAGESASAPEPDEHEGYVFAGWDVDFTDVQSDLTVTAVYVPAPLIGDVNCDGAVGFDDVTLLAAYIVHSAELSEQGLINADVDQNGAVSSLDISYLYNYLLNNPQGGE